MIRYATGTRVSDQGKWVLLLVPQCQLRRFGALELTFWANVSRNDGDSVSGAVGHFLEQLRDCVLEFLVWDRICKRRD